MFGDELGPILSVHLYECWYGVHKIDTTLA